jgi:hypothetical protein
LIPTRDWQAGILVSPFKNVFIEIEFKPHEAKIVKNCSGAIDSPNNTIISRKVKLIMNWATVSGQFLDARFLLPTYSSHFAKIQECYGVWRCRVAAGRRKAFYNRG